MKQPKKPRSPISFPEPIPLTPDDIKNALKQFPTISDAKKRNMLAAMAANLGIVTTAALAAKIHRDTHYDWMKNDPAYKKAVKSLKNISHDFVESKMFHRIAEGSDTMIIWYEKTQMRDRGYKDRINNIVEMDDDDEIDSTLDV